MISRRVVDRTVISLLLMIASFATLSGTAFAMQQPAEAGAAPEHVVTISGFTVPTLSTRRADTEVEIRNGESFVISGLLDHRTTDSLANVPGIANIPILGELFRSKNINHSIVELVVLVTATIVDPLTTTLSTAEPAMALPNMDSNVFDVRVRSTGKDKKLPDAMPPAVKP